MDGANILFTILLSLVLIIYIILLILANCDEKRMSRLLQKKLDKTKWSQKNGWEIDYEYSNTDEWGDY
jgi:hypothetical protein